MSCYINMKRYNEALATLDTITLHFPDYENGTLKRAFILDKMDKTKEALQLYLSAIEQSDEDMRIFLCYRIRGTSSAVHQEMYGSRSYEESIRGIC